MLLKILLVLALILLVFIVVVSLQPAEFQVVRTVGISAPPAAVFARVNDFHAWEEWSPWAKLDPAMTQTYEGAPTGTGSIYTWSGDSKVGAGRMTLTESRPSERVRITLEFLKPFAATNTTELSFKPEGQRTVVTWSMSGRNNFLFKAVGLFMNIEKSVGGDFEKGLAQLKAVVETR